MKIYKEHVIVLIGIITIGVGFWVAFSHDTKATVDGISPTTIQILESE